MDMTSVTRQRLWMVWQFARRDLLSKLRGSVLGLGWTVISPLVFLAAYVFVFVYVLQARWPGLASHGGTAGAALAILAGLSVHGFVAECLVRAPGLVREQPHLVTKVVFPLHWLPVTVVVSASFQLAASVLVLLLGVLWIQGGLLVTTLWVPVLLLPLVIAALASVWIVAPLGVFVRDVGQAVGPLVALLVFFSPVFWPLSSLPSGVRAWFELNPLTLPIEWMRWAVLGLGTMEWMTWLIYLVCSAAFALMARWFFLRLAPGFADEL